MDMKFEFKNMPFERPPPTDIPINPKNSYMTALSNFCVANGMKLRMKNTANGEAHMPMWTSVCTINENEYGRACAFTRKSAEKDAANQTIETLQREKKEGLDLPSSRDYYPMFRDYLVEQNLEERVEFRSVSGGLDHKPTWRCIVSLDGIGIGEGVGPNKKAAIEEASVDAAKNWPAA